MTDVHSIIFKKAASSIGPRWVAKRIIGDSIIVKTEVRQLNAVLADGLSPEARPALR
jgi:hypothetical protein